VTARQEFTKKTMALAFARANGLCEGCGSRLLPGQFDYDHIRECAYGGDNSLENCKVLCKTCHKTKTQEFMPGLRKADRVKKRHLGITKPSGRIQSAGFQKSGPQRRASKPLNKWYGWQNSEEEKSQD